MRFHHSSPPKPFPVSGAEYQHRAPRNNFSSTRWNAGSLDTVQQVVNHSGQSGETNTGRLVPNSV